MDQKRRNEEVQTVQKLITLSNLDMMQKRLENIEDAILLAKNGIPSSKLLSLSELKKMISFLAKHNIFIRTPEEMLAKSIAQATMNESHILDYIDI